MEFCILHIISRGEVYASDMLDELTAAKIIVVEGTLYPLLTRLKNAGFLECDGWILRERHRIEHIPATIIQGRYDMICPPHSAWSLAQGWPKCELKMVPMAGHALSEPGISEALVRVMDGLRQA